MTAKPVGWMGYHLDDEIAENADRDERASCVQGVKSSVKERNQ